MEKVVKRLIELNKTISTMESCTGGALVNSITNIPDSSKVIKFSAITYSNEFKIKMGVSEEIINKYSVYSMEVANEMSKCISNFTNSDYGIGITGKLNKIDEDNPYGDNSTVFISIYIKETNEFISNTLKVDKATRSENKELIINYIKDKLLEVL